MRKFFKIKNLFSVVFFVVVILGIGFDCFAIDNDNDGLDDAEEQEKLNLYAPKLIFHTDEYWKPQSVDEWLSNNMVNLIGLYKNNYVIDFVKNVTPEELGKPEWATDNKYTSFWYEGRMYYDTVKLALHGPTLGGRVTNPIYGRCFKTKDKYGTEYIELQYWIFYTYNDAIPIGITIDNKTIPIDHEGDWEFIGIRCDLRYNPQQVYYSAHYPENWTDEQARVWERITRDGNRPIVYVAKGTHANYFSSGKHQSWIPILSDILNIYWDECNTGDSWIPNVINLGEKDNPSTETSWLRYGGYWGWDYKHELARGSPKGPAYQTRNGSPVWDGIFYDCPGDILTKTFFYTVPKSRVKIYIYNIAAELVRVMDEGEKDIGDYTAIWDGKNDRGERCAFYVYSYTVKDNEETIKSGKIYPKGEISYTVSKKVVKIHIYNIAAEPIKTLDEGEKASGDYIAVWDGKNDAGKDCAYQVFPYVIKAGDTKIGENKFLLCYERPRIYEVTSTPNSFGSGEQNTISYKVTEKCKVTIRVFDSNGNIFRTIIDGKWQEAGLNSVTWDGKDDDGDDLPTGNYTYVISAFDQSMKPAVEVKETITYNIKGYTVKYGPTPEVVRTGNISFTDTVSPMLTNVYSTPEFFNLSVSTIDVYFAISEKAVVTLNIYNTQNSLIRQLIETCSGGNNVISWDGKDSLNEYVPDGLYSYTISAKDLSGNISSNGGMFGPITVDNTPPTVGITSPNEGQTVGGLMSIKASAEDSSGVEKVEFYIDNSWISTVYNPPYSCDLDTTKYPEGSHILKVVAYDTTGNQNTQQISVNVQWPIRFDGVGPFCFSSSGSTTISYTVSEISNVTIKVMNTQGNTVRTLIVNERKDVGEYSDITWDGRDNTGAVVNDGLYTVMVEGYNQSGVQAPTQFEDVVKTERLVSGLANLMGNANESEIEVGLAIVEERWTLFGKKQYIRYVARPVYTDENGFFGLDTYLPDPELVIAFTKPDYFSEWKRFYEGKIYPGNFNHLFFFRMDLVPTSADCGPWFGKGEINWWDLWWFYLYYWLKLDGADINRDSEINVSDGILIKSSIPLH